MQHSNNSIQISEAILKYKKELTSIISAFLDSFSKESIHDFYRSDLPKIGKYKLNDLEYDYRFHGNALGINCIDGTNKIDVCIFKDNGDFIDNWNDFSVSVHSLQAFLRSNNLCILTDNNGEVIG
ncbi:MAG: hypothetical protein ACRC3B_22980, partial [Bacteroidia bacterium]